MAKINVTQPSLPPLDLFYDSLKDIWESKWLTNNGKHHQQLEREIAEYLDVPYCSLFNNGMIALQVALQALRVTGDVITTPYSFVATAHALKWNGPNPIFVDIDPVTCNLDPLKIEAAITLQTTAIVPVHVYGTPCDIDAIQKIADTYGLKVIYDAAHAFGVSQGGQSVLTAGDISMVSFHSTKAFNTIEGGLLVVTDAGLKKRIDDLKNFGFVDETTVVGIGTNGKMNEIVAAYGLLQLKQVDADIAKRKQATMLYRELLAGVRGIRLLAIPDDTILNYSYFPIFIDEIEYGMGRDALYEKLKEHDIFARRYFYPLISEFSAYRGLNSSAKSNLPVAHAIADSVICLPLYSELESVSVHYVVNIIKKYVTCGIAD